MHTGFNISFDTATHDMASSLHYSHSLPSAQMGASPVDALVAQIVGELHLAAVRQEAVQVLLKLPLRALRQRRPRALRQVPQVLVLHRSCTLQHVTSA